MTGASPTRLTTLRTFPGIGEATAGALAAFAFNQPVVFIETNIRRVFLHCFFPGQSGVRDREILPLVDQTLDRQRPRPWYYALMDYGAMLKRAAPNPNRQERPPPAAGPLCRFRPPDPGPDPQGPPADPRRSPPRSWLRPWGKTRTRTTGLIHTLIKEGFLEQEGARLRIAAGADGPGGAMPGTRAAVSLKVSEPAQRPAPAVADCPQSSGGS